MGECDMTESARRAATFNMMAKLIEELRREQQHKVDFANGVV